MIVRFHDGITHLDPTKKSSRHVTCLSLVITLIVVVAVAMWLLNLLGLMDSLRRVRVGH
jgi:hypothetical protein